METDHFAEGARDQLAEEGAGVDSHVEDREAGVAARTTFRIQVTNDGRNVRLEQSGTADDQHEAKEEADLVE